MQDQCESDNLRISKLSKAVATTHFEEKEKRPGPYIPLSKAKPFHLIKQYEKGLESLKTSIITYETDKIEFLEDIRREMDYLSRSSRLINLTILIQKLTFNRTVGWLL